MVTVSATLAGMAGARSTPVACHIRAATAGRTRSQPGAHGQTKMMSDQPEHAKHQVTEGCDSPFPSRERGFNSRRSLRTKSRPEPIFLLLPPAGINRRATTLGVHAGVGPDETPGSVVELQLAVVSAVG